MDSNGDEKKSSGKQVKVSSDPLNDTRIITQNLCESLEELSKLKADVKRKHDTSLIRAARFRHSLKRPSTPS